MMAAAAILTLEVARAAQCREVELSSDAREDLFTAEMKQPATVGIEIVDVEVEGLVERIRYRDVVMLWWIC